MTPIFEARLRPKIKDLAAIRYIDVRVDDSEHIQTVEQCLTFLEQQFPFYDVAEIIRGYKQDVG